MNIGIIGLGLMGGSMAKSIKNIHPENSFIVAYDADPLTLEKAYDGGFIDFKASSVGADFSNCHIIFLCTPVNLIIPTIEALLPFVSSDCILTDIGSTKYEVVQSISSLLKKSDKNVSFIGGHPMTGSEKSGFSAATPLLFENAYYILTPTSETPDFVIFILTKLIERLGAIPITLSPSYHDFATATVSHLPHIIASTLVHLVKEQDGEKGYLHTLAAGGFKDITRIASSNPDVWESICFSNQGKIQRALEKYILLLQNFSKALSEEDHAFVHHYFENARNYRNTFDEGVKSTILKQFALYVDAKDTPGIIASIATLLCEKGINIKNIGIMNHREFERGIIKVLLDSQATLLEAAQILSQNNYSIYY